MPQNKKGGKGFKRAKKNSFQTPTFEPAQDGQFYGKLVKTLGDRRFSFLLQGSSNHLTGRARGSLKGWHNMKKDDIILVSNRDFRNGDDETFVQDTYDIIQYYLPEQVKKLIKMGELTDPTFTEVGESNVMYYNEEDEDSEEDIAPQRQYDLPDSESEDDNFDIDNL